MGNRSKRRPAQTDNPIEQTARSSHPYPEPQTTLTRVAAYQGPIPDPDTLSRYNDIMPGLADRIVKMAEEQSSHRQRMESTAIEAQTKDARAERTERRVGQVFALVISLAFLGCATYLAVRDRTVPSAIIGSGGVIGLAAVFIQGRRDDGKQKPAPSS